MLKKKTKHRVGVTGFMLGCLLKIAEKINRDNPVEVVNKIVTVLEQIAAVIIGGAGIFALLVALAIVR